MQILESDEFIKEYKKLIKKYPSLVDDIKVLKKAISAEPEGDGTKHWNCITRIEDVSFYKIRLNCRSVRGDKFRVVYRYNCCEVEILFIEIYFKGTKENHDIKRIESYLNS